MAFQAATLSSSLSLHLEKSACTRKLPRTFISWPVMCFAVLCIISMTQAQTFQYSRGWTNGKRSGSTGASAIGLVDLENGYISPDVADLGLPFPGRIQMSVSPQGRLRTLDYNQYLARKFGVGSSGNLNTRKQPLWVGTIMGMEPSDSSSSSSQAASGSSSNNLSGSSNDF